MITATPIYTVGVDERDPRYQCCCGCMHVRTGAIIIGVIELICSVSSLLAVFVSIGQGAGNRTGLPGTNIYGPITAIILIVVVIFMFVGIFQEKHTFVLPHLIYQIVGIVCLAIMAVTFVVLLSIGFIAVGSSQGQDKGEALGVLGSVAVVLTVIFAVYAALELWWFFVVLKLYKYLKAKNEVKISGSHVVQYANAAAGQGYST